MDVQTIDMDKSAARAAFLEYRRAIRDRHTEEDAEIMRGYRALARGQQLLDVHAVITAAGVDHRARPRLAIARADATFVHVERSKVRSDDHGTRLGAIFHSTASAHRWDHRRCGWVSARCVEGFRFPEFPDSNTVTDRLRARVPHIPAPLRPAANVGAYHILWEPEDWEEYPRDPILLRRVGGYIYAVVAMWELTDLEKAVLAGRVG